MAHIIICNSFCYHSTTTCYCEWSCQLICHWEVSCCSDLLCFLATSYTTKQELVAILCNAYLAGFLNFKMVIIYTGVKKSTSIKKKHLSFSYILALIHLKMGWEYRLRTLNEKSCGIGYDMPWDFFQSQVLTCVPILTLIQTTTWKLRENRHFFTQHLCDRPTKTDRSWL